MYKWANIISLFQLLDHLVMGPELPVSVADLSYKLTGININ